MNVAENIGYGLKLKKFLRVRLRKKFLRCWNWYSLKDMKKALFNELNETNAPTAQRESSGFFTDIRDYNTITEMADAVKTSSICAIEDTMKLLDPAIVERAAGKIIQADSVRLFGVNASSLVAQDLYYKLIRIGSPPVMRRICTFSLLMLQLWGQRMWAFLYPTPVPPAR